MDEELIYYSNGKNILLCNTNNEFIYYCRVNFYSEGYYSMINSSYFSSSVFIPNIISSYFINKNIEKTCELFAAPKSWLKENNYNVCSKPERKKKSSKLKIKNNGKSSI